MSEEEEVFEVEKVVAHKDQEDGRYYLIKWKGWSSSDNTWERTDNLFCPARIKEYWDEKEKQTLESDEDDVQIISPPRKPNSHPRKPNSPKGKQVEKTVFHIVETSDSGESSSSYSSDISSTSYSSSEIVAFTKTKSGEQIKSVEQETEESEDDNDQNQTELWVSESTDTMEVSDSLMPVEDDHLEWTRNNITIEAILPEKPIRFVVLWNGRRKIMANEEVKHRYPQQLIDFYVKNIRFV